MSDANLLIGYVAEPLQKFQPNPDFFRASNNAALARLPADDSWPPLCRSLFAVTGDDALHGSYKHQRLIHFAGRFNHLINHFDEWLDKFDRLLKLLYWLEAEISITPEWGGPPFMLQYRVSPETIANYMSNAPRPPQEWELRGYRLEIKRAGEEYLAEFIGKERRLIEIDP